MTIHPEHLPHLDRLRPYYSAPMLVLGETASAVPEYPSAREYFGQWVGKDYQTLDLDGGDLMADLNEDIGLSQTHQTVFNIGTIEHVWNAHNAWANALRAVQVGGYFLTHGPVSGYHDHGLHVTSAPAIRAFVSKNGFTILDDWITTRAVGGALWLAACKNRHIEELGAFEPAWQVYEAGEKKQVR